LPSLAHRDTVLATRARCRPPRRYGDYGDPRVWPCRWVGCHGASLSFGGPVAVPGLEWRRFVRSPPQDRRHRRCWHHSACRTTGRACRPTPLPAIVCLGCFSVSATQSSLELPRTDPTVVNFTSCIPTVRGSCDLLGDLEQQPEATITGAFVMLLGSPAAIEAAAAREATAAPAAVYAPAGPGPDRRPGRRPARRSRQRHLVRRTGTWQRSCPGSSGAPGRRHAPLPRPAQMSLPSLTAPNVQR
jgi:hypothetical protein